MVSAVPRVGVHRKTLPESRFQRKADRTLISGKPLFYEGELYSEEHKCKFKTEEAGFQVVKDPKGKSKLALAINGQLIGEWFKEQFNKLLSPIQRMVIPNRKNKGLGLQTLPTGG